MPILTNARLILADEVVTGSIAISDDRIGSIDKGLSSLPAARDCEGDFVLPGLIDLHTDNLERHYQPRTGVTWDGIGAAVAHDAQVAASGITTIFDSLTIGAAEGWDVRAEMIGPMIDGLLTAQGLGMLRVDHRLHLRCETTHPEITSIYEHYASMAPVHLMSLMDHTPGDRQEPDLEGYRARFRRAGHSEAVIEANIRRLQEASRTLGPTNRRRLAELARQNGVALATHDDASVEHVEEAFAFGASFSEFPTTVAAAEAAHRCGIATMMGSPNLVRGRSHSGNVAAASLAERGLLDMLASDYIPASLLTAAFFLARGARARPLHAAVASVTSQPARAVGLEDRGRLEPGLRADLVRVRVIDDRPLVREVWSGGRRVA